MSGIRITRSKTAAVHAEGAGGGEAATLCGKGADYIAATDEAVSCKSCMKSMSLETLRANTDQILQEAARERAGATVIITGGRVHAEGVPCGTVYDDDLVSGVDTDASADCHACLSQPKERIAGDGSMIRVGSRVIVAAEGTSDGSTPTGIVTSLADYADGEWVELVTVTLDIDGLPYGYNAMNLATDHGDAWHAENCRRAAIRDGVYRHIMGQPPVNPAVYGSDQVAALAHVHAWLTGHWGCECTGYGPNGGKLVYLLTSVTVTVCACGKLPSDEFHKRNCPSQEARGIHDGAYVSARVAEINAAAGITQLAERSARWSRRNGGKGRKTRAGGRKGRRS